MISTLKIQLLGGLAISVCLLFAILIQAQYNTFDSDSNSDSDGSPILAQSELGKLVRSAGKSASSSNGYGQEARNSYQRQQPMQLAPSHYNQKRSSNDGHYNSMAGSPFSSMGAAGSGMNSRLNSLRGEESSAANNGAGGDDDDDRESSNFGPNFGANFDAGESRGGAGSQADRDDDEREGASANNDDGDGSPMNLNQAASGYAGQGAGQADSAGFGAGFGFGADSSAFGPSDGPSDGAGYGPSDDGSSSSMYDGRRAKSGSAPSGLRNAFGGDDDAAGAALRYGPNSAVNSGDRDPDDEGRAAYSPEGGSQANDQNDDDE